MIALEDTNSVKHQAGGPDRERINTAKFFITQPYLHSIIEHEL